MKKKDNVSGQPQDGLNPIDTKNSANAVAFSQYYRDIFGIFLIMLAVITLLALFGWSKGILINQLDGFLRKLFGVGSYFVALSFFILGIDTLLETTKPDRTIPLGKILQLEATVFCLLPLLSILNTHSLEDAINGLHGGIVGWGLGSLFLFVMPPLLAALMLILLIIFLFLSGTGLLQLGFSVIDHWSQSFLKKTSEKPASAIVEENVKPQGSMFDEDLTDENQYPQSSIQPATASINRRGNLPSLDLLITENTYETDEEHIRNTAILIEKTLQEFQVPTRVVGYRVGPTVTQYAIEPGFKEIQRSDGTIHRKKIRISQISNLQRDLARALSAERLRIEAPVPGHSYVGIEVANPKSTIVRLRSLLESDIFKKVSGKPLMLTLGRDVSGNCVMADLSSMPHLLIAGTTGSGKSVCLEALITSLLMNNSPAELRLAMLDPKMVELVRFNGVPHLLGQVETEHERMLTVLRWALVEMENRYRMLESVHTRDLDAYNRKMKRQNRLSLPRIVILIDELADLMMIAPDQTEHSLTRLAQKARATGIHLIVATQRPSTDVVTGMIKANFPARIAFQVATGIDSRVIIDTGGAEDLLGNGDMLYVDPTVRSPIRAQGVLISDTEIERVIEYWQEEFTNQETRETFTKPEAPWEEMIIQEENQGDKLFDKAVAEVRNSGRANASWLQRSLHIGYPRAASLLDKMEEEGIVGRTQSGGRDREILPYDKIVSEEEIGKMEDSHQIATEENQDPSKSSATEQE